MYDGETEPIPRITDRGGHDPDRRENGRRSPDRRDPADRDSADRDSADRDRRDADRRDAADRDRRDPARRETASRAEVDLPAGHGHGHGHTPAEPASQRVRTIIAALLVPFALAAVVGVVLLYPFGDGPKVHAGAGTPVDGVVTSAGTGACNGDVQVGGQNGAGKCLVVTVRMTDGAAANREIRTIVPLEPSTPRFAVDDKVVLAYGGGNPADGQSYQLVDFQRSIPLALLAGLFAIVVLALGRWQGVKALVALVISFVVLVFFVLPAILAGESPLLVGIVGAGVIMFVVLYLTHGLTARTSTAVLGTMMSLTLIGVLGALWAAFGKLTGLDEDTATLVGLLNKPIDTRGLLLAGVVIGALGVLDDVTVTQTSAVWELRAANSSLTRRQLYLAGLRIGRDHVASAVNTLVMAYAGAALPLLLYSSISGVGIGNILTSQSIAQEIVRTLVGSIGIVAAVPVTTALAAAVAAQEKPAAEEVAAPPKRRPAGRAGEPDRAVSRDKQPPRERTARERSTQERSTQERTNQERTTREPSANREKPAARERAAAPGESGARETSVSRRAAERDHDEPLDPPGSRTPVRRPRPSTRRLE
ncbi:YibE/F family protein [Actinophytocola sp.]|uniref:YibE/F family protein n=1 Tax=Actinophytocola sp. TaxID=1872138 RepID=UPI002D2EAFA0|nr:YibE/F family protein [Actinophytocola sp.]HYQ62097.1 YibE/F family protein [Actinophytocola sp.]